jgi:hypothetical protein
MASGLEETVWLLLSSGWFSGLLSGSISSSSASLSMLWVVSASVNWLDSSSIAATEALKLVVPFLVLDWKKESYLFCSCNSK